MPAKKKKKTTKSSKPTGRPPAKKKVKKAVKKPASKKAAVKKTVAKKSVKKAAPEKPPPATTMPRGIRNMPPAKPCICIENANGWFCMKKLRDGSLTECRGPFTTQEECESHTCR